MTRPVSFFGLVEVFLVPAEVDLVVVLVVLLLAALDLLVGFAVLVDFTFLCENSYGYFNKHRGYIVHTELLLADWSL